MLGDDLNEALEKQNRNEALRSQQEREKRNNNNQKKNYISKEPNDMMPSDSLPGDNLNSFSNDFNKNTNVSKKSQLKIESSEKTNYKDHKKRININITNQTNLSSNNISTPDNNNSIQENIIINKKKEFHY